MICKCAKHIYGSSSAAWDESSVDFDIPNSSVDLSQYVEARNMLYHRFNAFALVLITAFVICIMLLQ